jgi:prevent-host-death family protein
VLTNTREPNKDQIGVKTVTIQQAKTDFVKLIALVCKGEEIIITRGLKPVAKLIPFGPYRRKKRLYPKRRQG